MVFNVVHESGWDSATNYEFIRFASNFGEWSGTEIWKPEFLQIPLSKLISPHCGWGREEILLQIGRKYKFKAFLMVEVTMWLWPQTNTNFIVLQKTVLSLITYFKPVKFQLWILWHLFSRLTLCAWQKSVFIRPANCVKIGLQPWSNFQKSW